MGHSVDDHTITVTVDDKILMIMMNEGYIFLKFFIK